MSDYVVWTNPIHPVESHVALFEERKMTTSDVFVKRWCMHKQIMCQYANANGFCSITACIMQLRENKNDRL